MEKLFHDIVSMTGVHGVVLLSAEGKVLYESLDGSNYLRGKSALSWKAIVDSLEDFREMDLIFERGRCYMRKTESGFLIISVAPDVSIAMIKLNCDIVIPELKKMKTTGKGLKRFFKF